VTSHGPRPTLPSKPLKGPSDASASGLAGAPEPGAEIAETRLPRRRDNTQPQAPAGPEQGRPQRVRKSGQDRLRSHRPAEDHRKLQPSGQEGVRTPGGPKSEEFHERYMPISGNMPKVSFVSEGGS
jgi:hypothetical protein